jgi:hypothetical protein
MLNAKKLFGTIAGLAVLAGLSWHQTRNDAPGAGMEDLMTGTALETPPAEVSTPDIASSPEIAAEPECEPSEEPGAESDCEAANGLPENGKSG